MVFKENKTIIQINKENSNVFLFDDALISSKTRLSPAATSIAKPKLDRN